VFPDLSQISPLESHRINEGKAVGDPFDMNAAYDAEQTVKELAPLTRKLNHQLLFLLARLANIHTSVDRCGSSALT
jgi:hypothetical protein